MKCVFFQPSEGLLEVPEGMQGCQSTIDPGGLCMDAAQHPQGQGSAFVSDPVPTTGGGAAPISWRCYACKFINRGWLPGIVCVCAVLWLTTFVDSGLRAVNHRMM